MTPSIFHRIQEALNSDRRRLVSHPLYSTVDDVDRLRPFMEHHVFAVWDFMSLVKRLQRELTCPNLPWRPPAAPKLARFINEIVLDEESDLGLDGEACSHFDLYLAAMEEVGANTEPIRAFLGALGRGADPIPALADAGAPPGVHDFVARTLQVALHGDPLEVAACFLFGREDVIPDMFQALCNRWPQGRRVAPHFVFYLERHIELDGGEHAARGRELLEELHRGAGPGGTARAIRSAAGAIEARLALWDATHRVVVETSTGRALAFDR